VVLIGDRRQLASVAGASALRAVSEVVERSAALLQVRRQLVDWQCAASVVMARGDAEAGLRAYASHDRVELVSGEVATQERVIAVWREQRARYGEDVLIVARRNRDAAALNARARAVLREEGRLGPDVIAAPSLDRSDKRVELALAAGDRIRFGETLPHSGIRNGNHAEVQAIRTEQGGSCILTLRLEDGRVIEEAWNRLAREPRFGRKALPPRVVHAYSGTVYAAQGRTSQAAVLHIASSTDAREIYVGLTRHRHDARVVVEGGRLDALCRQRQADPRMAPTPTALMERLFAEASQYREKANVVDHVPDRSAFIRTGVLDVHARAPVLDVSRAVRASRALHQALVWLGLAPLIVPAWRIIQQQVRRVPADLQARLSDMRARLIGRAPARAEYRRGGPER
jgi:ATP-dependent exoDNAse (exonuclease V) alpha subunit